MNDVLKAGVIQHRRGARLAWRRKIAALTPFTGSNEMGADAKVIDPIAGRLFRM